MAEGRRAAELKAEARRRAEEVAGAVGHLCAVFLDPAAVSAGVMSLAAAWTGAEAEDPMALGLGRSWRRACGTALAVAHAGKVGVVAEVDTDGPMLAVRLLFDGSHAAELAHALEDQGRGAEPDEEARGGEETVEEEEGEGEEDPHTAGLGGIWCHPGTLH